MSDPHFLSAKEVFIALFQFFTTEISILGGRWDIAIYFSPVLIPRCIVCLVSPKNKQKTYVVSFSALNTFVLNDYFHRDSCTTPGFSFSILLLCFFLHSKLLL